MGAVIAFPNHRRHSSRNARLGVVAADMRRQMADMSEVLCSTLISLPVVAAEKGGVRRMRTSLLLLAWRLQAVNGRLSLAEDALAADDTAQAVPAMLEALADLYRLDRALRHVSRLIQRACVRMAV